MAEQGFRFGRRAVQQIAEVVRRVLREPGNQPVAAHTGLPVQPLITGVTIGTITAATSVLDGETTFTFARLRKASSGDLEDSTARLTGTNRDTTLTALDGTVIICALVDGEWRPIWVGCEPDADVTGLT